MVSNFVIRAVGISGKAKSYVLSTLSMENEFPPLNGKNPSDGYYFRVEEAVEVELKTRVCDLNVPTPAWKNCAGIENEWCTFLPQQVLLKYP